MTAFFLFLKEHVENILKTWPE